MYLRESRKEEPGQPPEHARNPRRGGIFSARRYGSSNPPVNPNAPPVRGNAPIPRTLYHLIPMRILLSALGSSGDINPFLAIALALRDRSHQPILLLDPHHAARAAALGIEARTFTGGIDPDAARNHPDYLHPTRGTGVFLRDILMPCLEPLHTAAREILAHEKPDIAIVHHVCFSIPWACEQAGVAWGMAATAPASWMSFANPNRYPMMPDRDAYRPWLLRPGNALGRWITAMMVDPAVNRLRRKLGLPAQRHIMLEQMLSGTINLGLWSPNFRSPAADDHPRSRITGWPILPTDPAATPTDEQQRLDAFLADAPPPILITFGSSIGRADACAMQLIEQTLPLLRERVLLVAPTDAARRLSKDSASVCAVSYAPYASIIPRCSLILHHAGMGTTAQTLRSGIPSVLLPHAHDQFDNARRTRMLGCARTIDAHRATPDRLAEILADTLADEAMRARCRELAEQFSREDGAAATVDALEQVVGASESADSTTKQDAPPRAHATTASR